MSRIAAPRPAAALAVGLAAAVWAPLLVAPVAAAPPDRTPRTMAPCRYEDGPGPCVWDARHRGNGEGVSFVVRRDGRVVHITHRRAHRLAA